MLTMMRAMQRLLNAAIGASLLKITPCEVRPEYFSERMRVAIADHRSNNSPIDSSDVRLRQFNGNVRIQFNETPLSIDRFFFFATVTQKMRQKALPHVSVVNL